MYAKPVIVHLAICTGMHGSKYIRTKVLNCTVAENNIFDAHVIPHILNCSQPSINLFGWLSRDGVVETNGVNILKHPSAYEMKDFLVTCFEEWDKLAGRRYLARPMRRPHVIP